MKTRKNSCHGKEHTIFPNALCQAQVVEHEKILSRREVAAIFGVSVVTLWRMVRRGMFPAPVSHLPGARWLAR